MTSFITNTPKTAHLPTMEIEKATETKDAVNLRSPLRIRVTGYAFYDAYHYSARWQTSKPGRCDFSPAELYQRGKGHGTCNVGTIWELHPVWKIERLR